MKKSGFAESSGLEQILALEAVLRHEELNGLDVSCEVPPRIPAILPAGLPSHF
jgi:hypothetical protein